MMATATGAGLLPCHSCGLLNRAPATAGRPACARCHAGLHPRKPASLARTWALLIAACILYIPANVLPVMHTGSLFGSQSDTILSGVTFLWRDGSWLLATIIFVASIVIPATKILALAWLLYSVGRGHPRDPRQQTRIYRAIDYIGRWSMVDIYVGAVLVALVQFNTIALITAGPGALAFALVVVLTMFAAQSFDPRLVWDVVDRDREARAA